MINFIVVIFLSFATLSYGQISNTSWYTSAIEADPETAEFVISTADELAGLAVLVNNGIDNFAGKTVSIAKAISLEGLYANWTPIGNTSANAFKGTFDGGKYPISNLVTSGITTTARGFFGFVNGGVLKNVNLVSAYVSYAGNAGVLAGNIVGSKVEDCYATGEVIGPTATSSSLAVGGLVGYAKNSKLSRSYFSGSVSSSGNNVGGLVGSLDSANSVFNSYSIGSVRGNNYVGGLVGNLVSTRPDSVFNSYSASAVSGANNVGGLVGYTNSGNQRIYNSAALNPEVKGTGTNVNRINGGGITSSSVYVSNAAFAEMGNNYGDTVWANKGETTLGGGDISLASILSDGTIGNRFITSSGWLIVNGKLPVLSVDAQQPSHFDADIVYRIAMRPLNPSAGKGGTRQFSAAVFGRGSNKDVVWSISGNKSAFTNIDSQGLLTVDANETATALTVTATSDADPGISRTTNVSVVDAKYIWYVSAIDADPNEKNFTISNVAELVGFADIVNGTWGGTPTRDNFSGKTVTLAAAINLNEYLNWIPIGNYNASTSNVFSGTFDGGNKTISGLYIENSATYQGLFGRIASGTLKNVKIINADVTGSGYVGGLVGYAYSSSRTNASTISYCSVVGTVKGTATAVGGLVGEASYANISNSYFSGSVSNTAIRVGGLVGNLEGSIANSYSTGSVSGTANSVGGLIGYWSGTGTNVSNSYSTSFVSGVNSVGGLVGAGIGNISGSAALNPEVKGTGGLNVGRISGSSEGTRSNNVAFNEMGNNFGDTVWVNKGFTSIDGQNITLAEIKKNGNIARFSSNNGWSTEDGKLPGFGEPVELPEHFTANVYRVAVLPANSATIAGKTVQFSAKVFGLSTEKGVVWSIAEASPLTNISESGLLTIDAGEPVGSRFTITATSKADPYFFGSTTVSLVAADKYGWYINGNLTISTYAELVGLADIVNGAWSGGSRDDFAGKTITLAANLDLTAHIGLIASWTPIGNYASDSRNVFRGIFDGGGKTISKMLINRDSTYRGLFGAIINGGVKNLGLIDVDVTGGQYTGGIAGHISNSRIDNSYVTGKITGKGNIGSIVGAMAAKSYMLNSYSTAGVTNSNTNNNVGGLVGLVTGESIISNSYSTGAVSSSNNASYLGGIAGRVEDGSSVINSYATGAVSGASSYIGGIAGMISGSTSTVTNCVALNSKVSSNASSYYYRVAYRSGGSLLNNIAFAEMKNHSDETTWSSKGANAQDGADITIDEIAYDGSFGGRFHSDNGWTTRNGYLPGFGKLNNYLEHLPSQQIEGQERNFPQTTLKVTYTEDLTLADIKLAEWFRWVDPTTPVYVGNNQKFDAHYSWDFPVPMIGQITLNVERNSTEIPDFVPIEPITVQYINGLTLQSVPLPSKDYRWADPSIRVNAGTMLYYAMYTSPNYSKEASGQVMVMAYTGNGTLTIGDWIYGEPANVPETRTTTNGAATLSYVGTTNGGIRYNSGNPPTQAGIYTLTAEFAAKDGHDAVIVSKRFTVHRAQGEGVVSIEGWKIGSVAPEPVVSSSTNGTNNISFRYSSSPGASWHPTPSQPTNPGRYMLEAIFPANNNYVEVRDTTYFAIASNEAKPLTVIWSKDSVFTYNKKVQSPVPLVMDGNDTIKVTLLNAQSEAGKYDGMLKARVIIEDEVKARDFVLLNNVKAYEIKQKPLAARFKVDRPTDAYDANADTIWVPSRIFTNLDTLRNTLEGIIDYEGFAIDTVKRESDDVSVLRGKPTVEVGYVRSSLFSALTKRVETTQKAIATIVTDDMSANNYKLERREIVVMEAIIETNGATQIFCNLNSKYVRMGERSCEALDGEVFTKLFCVSNNKCLPITDDLPIAACTEAEGMFVTVCPVELPIDGGVARAPTIRVWQTASGIVNMDLGYMPAKPVSVQIYDLKGKLVAIEHVNTRFANIRVNMASGMYLLKVGDMVSRVPVR